MTWPFLAAIAAAVFAIGATTGSQFAKNKAADTALALYEANAKATQRRLDAVDAAAAAHESDKARTDAFYLDVERLVTDVKKTEFYAAGNMCFDVAGLRAINARSTAAPGTPASKPAPAMR